MITLQPILADLPTLHSSHSNWWNLSHPAFPLFTWSLLPSSSSCPYSPLLTRPAHRPLQQGFIYSHKASLSLFRTSARLCWMNEQMKWTSFFDHCTRHMQNTRDIKMNGPCHCPQEASSLRRDLYTGKPLSHNVLHDITEGRVLITVYRYGWESCPSLTRPPG